MKKIISLLLLIPLATIAAEHAGKAVQKKMPTQQASEHGGKAMEKKEHAGKAAEHGGKAMEEKPAEYGEKDLKKTDEHADADAE